MPNEHALDNHLAEFRRTGEVRLLDHRIADLALAASESDDPGTVACYAQLLAARITASLVPPAQDRLDRDIEELRAAVFRLRNSAPVAPMSLLVEGLLSVVRLATARDHAEVGKHHVRARRYLDNAYRSEPDNPEIQLAIGQFKFKTPPKGGPQAKEGEALLRDLAKDPRYTSTVARLGVDCADLV